MEVPIYGPRQYSLAISHERRVDNNDNAVGKTAPLDGLLLSIMYTYVRSSAASVLLGLCVIFLFRRLLWRRRSVVPSLQGPSSPSWLLGNHYQYFPHGAKPDNPPFKGMMRLHLARRKSASQSFLGSENMVLCSAFEDALVQVHLTLLHSFVFTFSRRRGCSLPMRRLCITSFKYRATVTPGLATTSIRCGRCLEMVL